MTSSARGLDDALPQRRLYGRRRGRPLRLGQRALVETLLPQLDFALPARPALLDPYRLFADPVAEVWLEVGFGAGEHLAFQAEAHPDCGIIGSEVFEPGIARLLAEIDSRQLRNVRLFVDDARLLIAALKPQSLGRAFILHPDPWPKERHKKRRIVSRETLDNLAVVLRDGAELRLATDDPDYLAAMLAAATDAPEWEWLARRPGDWRARPDDWPPTRYEQKAIAAGRTPAYLCFRRRQRP